MADLQSAISDSLPENVTPDSLPAQADVTQDPSPAAPAATPAPQVEPKEPPFHEHPRWIERQREMEQLRQTNQLLQQKLFELTDRVTLPQQSASPQADPEAGMSLEEREFYRKQRQLAREEAMKVLQEQGGPIQKELRETKETLATLAYERFLSKYPDVQPGSQKESQIAELYRRGYSLDDAYAVVSYPELVQQKAQKVQQTQTQQIQKKVAANVETQTIPSISGLPTQKKVNFREAMDKALRDAGV